MTTSVVRKAFVYIAAVYSVAGEAVLTPALVRALNVNVFAIGVIRTNRTYGIVDAIGVNVASVGSQVAFVIVGTRRSFVRFDRITVFASALERA